MRWALLLGLCLSGCMEQEYSLISLLEPVEGVYPELIDAHGGVRGRVCAPSGASWVSGATVWVSLDDGTIVQAKTDGEGWYNLRDVPPGQWLLHVKKGSFNTSFPVSVQKDLWTVLASETCLISDVEVAVVTGDFDHVETVLDKLGVPFDVYKGRADSEDYVDLLTDWSELSSYDVLFFNCGMSTNWLEDEKEVIQNIRRFVAEGGSVYASDWAYFILERSFPDLIDFYGDDEIQGDAAAGESGVYQASVEDPSLKAALGGNSVDLNFDLGSWVVAREGEPESTLIRGEVQLITKKGQSKTVNAPLVIQSERGGKILFTSFHTEHQTTTDMEAILEQVVLSL